MSSAVCGYYGKLPISPEFLRLNAAGPELRWLDEWFQHGVLYAKEQEGPRWSMLTAESDLWNFLHVPVDQGRIVCGVIFASQDQAGRFFPFLNFLLIDRHDFARTPWIVPLMASHFLESATSGLQFLRKYLDWKAFCRAEHASEPYILRVQVVTEGYQSFLRKVTAEEWWTTLFGNFDDPRKYRLVHGMKRTAHVWKQRAGLRFPLVLSETLGHYVLPFWIQATLTSVFSEKQNDLGMFAFWNGKPTKVEPCALISIGSASSHIVRFIVSPEVHDDAWCDVIGDQASNRVDDTLGHESLRVLSDPSLPLEKLLPYLSGLSGFI